MRVTSQQLRQFVVVQDGVLDPYILAENVALFNADGTPLEGIEESGDASAMVWRGPWVEGTDYNEFDVVSYDLGSDPGIFIFNENVSGPNYLFDSYPLDALLTEDSFPVTMVVDGSISRSDNLSGADNPFRAYGIKIAEAGQLHLSTAPVDSARDMIAVLFRLEDDGVTWTSVASGDDEAGAMHPAINTAVTPGVYLFAFTILGGDNPDAYGTSTLTLDGSNTAVLGTWGAASFPVDSVIRLVAEGGGSRLPPGGADGEFLAKASAADGDAEWVPAPEGGSGGTGDGGTGGGTGGMQFFGEWAPGSYSEQSIVTHDDKLWIATEEIIATEFAHIGVDSDAKDSGTISVDVHPDTQVGDLLVWISTIGSYSQRAKPSDYLSWTTIVEQPFDATAFPPGYLGVYAKLADTDDLGASKTYALPASQNAVVQLRVFRGAGMPIPAQTDVGQYIGHSYGTPVNATAVGNPAETVGADKVLRAFGCLCQNYAYDTGVVPTWESSSDDQDAVITDIHNWMSVGSYWADPAAVNPPDFILNNGEHKYVGAAAIRLPSPSAWDPDAWDQIAITDIPAGVMIFRGVWDEDVDYAANEVVIADDSLYISLGGTDAGWDPTALPGLVPTTVPFHGSRAGYLISPNVPITTPPATKVSGYNGSPSLFLKYEAAPGTEVTFTWSNDDSIYAEDGAGNGVYRVGTFSAFGSSPSTFVVPASGVLALELRDLDNDLAQVEMTGGVTEDAEGWMLIAILAGGGAGAATEAFRVVGAAGQPAFTNSWAAHASADHKPRFRKRPDGTVEMRGLIISGNSDQAAFTLPVGYRPVSPGGLQMVVMAAATGTGAALPARLDVEPDGRVVPFISGSSIVWLSLAAIQFSVD